MLVAIAEKFLVEQNGKMALLCKKPLSNYSSRAFLLEQRVQGRNCAQLSNGYWINVSYGIPVLIRIIRSLCTYCDIETDDIDIRYLAKSEAGEQEASNRIDLVSFTIKEAVTKVLSDTMRPMTIDEIYNKIIEQNLYTFKAQNPVNVVRTTIESACDNSCCENKDFVPCFHFEKNDGGKRIYSLLEAAQTADTRTQEQDAELLDVNSVGESAPSVPDALLAALNRNYASGFRFDTTYINLLSNASGVVVDERVQSALKQIMFHRDDDIFFLLDTVADAAMRKNIVDFADAYLQEFGCFEIPEFYRLYEDKVNPNCVRNADDFESFYGQISNSGVRCVRTPQIGNRIARVSNGNVWGAFETIASKIVSVITEKFYGSCNEDDLHIIFCVFSTDLLGKIVKYCAANELIRVEINGSVCYQTFDVLGLPENFSEVLAETLEKLDDIGLEPTQDVLHTAISLELGLNFKEEFNLPDWDTYRRLIAAFYKAEPRREWKSNIFWEVAD